MQPKILTVLQSGGEYAPWHVARLARQVAAQGYQLLALSDVPVNVPYRSPEHDFPGWWAKINLFTIPGPVLYMDLDTTVVGDLAPLLDQVSRHSFIGLRDFYRGGDNLGSGLMGWSGDMRHIFDAFLQNPDAIMASHRTSARWGDQGFIASHTPDRAYWQDIAPGAVFSYKRDCKGGVPDGAKVICFHGKPRPWDLDEELAA